MSRSSPQFRGLNLAALQFFIGIIKLGTAQANFKPISIQGLWSCYQTLSKLIAKLCTLNSPVLQNRDLSSLVNSSRIETNEWEYDEDLWSKRPDRFLMELSGSEHSGLLNLEIENFNLNICRINPDIKFKNSKLRSRTTASFEIHDLVFGSSNIEDSNSWCL